MVTSHYDNHIYIIRLIIFNTVIILYTFIISCADKSSSIYIYQQGCNSGDMWVVTACGNLGVMYHNWAGVEQDYIRTIELYKNACDGDEMGDCNNLGILYENKSGVEKDLGKALDLYKKSCDKDDRENTAPLIYWII